MAKFTVFFKDKPIHSSIFESGVVHIGRDETNDVAVDSLAIAPAHAAVIIRDTNSIIKQLNTEFPLIINGEQLKECALKNGDSIIIGKHRIVYSSTETIVEPPTPIFGQNSNEKDFHEDLLDNTNDALEANLQVIGGKHIGRLIPLKKNMTRLGRNGTGIIIITRRKEGFYVSTLEPDDSIKINDIPLGNQTVLLKDNDVILIDSLPMQFFLE
ncbi:MAG: FHA domain-containing protein [Methyloprofundus sp.]|nr:FHA domain-containing protein [Methyloprofundus sp.]